MSDRTIKGWHVAAMFGGGFAVIVGVNAILAFQAIATFPGLETRNSYVASQSFDADRAAQEALGWTVEAGIERDMLTISFKDSIGAVEPEITQATLGRATHVGDDRELELSFDGGAFSADVPDLGPGNWNLRLEAVAADGTVFRRRIVLRVPG